MTEVDSEAQGEGEKQLELKKKKRKKPKGHRAKTGSPPNQFGLAESGCTICHQSTFAVLSALPSIYRGHPLCTLLRNKTRRRNRNTEEKMHTHFHESDLSVSAENKGEEAP